jgi:hypothetical protein
MAVVTRNNTLLLVGGRDSTVFLNDVWASEDGGETWARRGSQPPFEPRGYHTLVVASSGCVVLAAGQNFRAFFNDVWTSCDEGHSWQLLSPAGRNDSGIFSARAGAAMALHPATGQLVMTGGSYSPSSIFPTSRQFFNDVWASSDGGANWARATPAAAWPARSGPRLVAASASASASTELFLVAGEVGFAPANQFGDVWRTVGGDLAVWTRVSANSSWAPRSGHAVYAVGPLGAQATPTHLLLVGGWPLLYDVWLLRDPLGAGANAWEQQASAYNCASDACGRFDFAFAGTPTAVWAIAGSHAQSTFGKMFNETWLLSPTPS